jgi:hypothetical protein
VPSACPEKWRLSPRPSGTQQLPEARSWPGTALALPKLLIATPAARSGRPQRHRLAPAGRRARRLKPTVPFRFVLHRLVGVIGRTHKGCPPHGRGRVQRRRRRVRNVVRRPIMAPRDLVGGEGPFWHRHRLPRSDAVLSTGQANGRIHSLVPMGRRALAIPVTAHPGRLSRKPHRHPHAAPASTYRDAWLPPQQRAPSSASVLRRHHGLL